MAPSAIAAGGHIDEIEARPAGDSSQRREGGGLGPYLGQAIIGRYRVIRKLGAGRLATVYLGEEVSSAKKIALKVFHRKFSRDQEFVAQFYRQARLAMALAEKHPHIASVYECERADDGSLFAVMEYLDGQSLREVILAEGPLEVERALLLASQIAQGLEAAHDLGVVHSEIRPQNVLLVTENQRETVKLKGFEAAGLLEAGLAGHLTRAGLLPGSPECVAPEQIEGGEITSRTDVYGLGAVLYEMLSGIAPFRASTSDGVLAKHLQDVPVSLRESRPEIPSVVELKVMQALEKEPEKRHRYIADVANEYLRDLATDELAMEKARRKFGIFWKPVAKLQGFLAGTAEEGDEDGPPGRKWKLAAIAALAALVFVPVVWTLAFRPPADIPPVPSLPKSVIPPRAPMGADRPGPSAPAGETPARAAVTTGQLRSVLIDAPPPTPADRTLSSGARAMSSSLSGRTALRSTDAESASSRKARRAGQSQAQVRVRGRGEPSPVAKTPPTTGRGGSRQDSDPTDSTAIIDWILKNPGKE